jgi:hypothetical protein
MQDTCPEFVSVRRGWTGFKSSARRCMENHARHICTVDLYKQAIHYTVLFDTFGMSPAAVSTRVRSSANDFPRDYKGCVQLEVRTLKITWLQVEMPSS